MLTQARSKRINATRNHTDHKKTHFAKAFKLRWARGKTRATASIETSTAETSAIARCVTSFSVSTCNANGHYNLIKQTCVHHDRFVMAVCTRAPRQLIDCWLVR